MASRPRIFVTRRLPEPVHAHLRDIFDVHLNEGDRPIERSALAEAMTRYDGMLLAIGQKFDAGLIGTPDATVRIVANFGVGVDHIELEAAKRAGIVVTNTPDALTDATADLAMMLILMAARRAGEAERLVRAGGWKGWGPTAMLGQSLDGKLLGIAGFGRIGQAVARRAAGFGMRIAYYARRRAPPAIEEALNAGHVPGLAQLAEAADVLSLHVPGGPDTLRLIDAAMLARMKPTAILVNTARGSVVDEAALVEALREGRIAAAGLDVFEREPEITPALRDLENVVLLPHLGSATIEARTAMGMQAAANLEAFFAGREPPNRVA